MVVCKCRKATKLYCFVHKVPVCGECICANEHQICVVRTYSDWVIDGDYDWPPKCNICQGVLQNAEVAVTRLGCLHVFHGECFARHLQGFPPHTAPAGYNCPECLAPIWPPKSVKDYNCLLVSKLKEVISQNGLSKALLGTDTVGVQLATTPPAFDSAPLSEVALEQTVSHHDTNGTPGLSNLDSTNLQERNAVNSMDDASGPHSLAMADVSKTGGPSAMNPGTMTRKTSYRADKMGYAERDDSEDDDGGRRKYSRRGPLQNQAFKYLLPFWSNALPTLPVTTPSRKEDHSFSIAEEIIEGRPRRRPARGSGVNTKKVLLVIAIMSCMATMMLLYYRLLQGNPSEDLGQFSNHEVAEG